MTMLSPAQAEDQLRDLAQQFTQWRQSRTTPRGRIPQPLWAQAVALSHVLPLARVAKQLGLTPHTVKRRGGGQAAAPTPLPAAGNFVEVDAPAWQTPTTAEVEIQRADGTRMRITYRETTPEAFLRVIAPYRDDLVVGVECIFTWYWLADLCQKEGIAFVLGHALYMKAIHGGKAKNDKIDAHKIAVLLRGGMFPLAYVYPAEMRVTRDLLRRRCHLVRKRAELLAHIHNTNSQYNLPELEKRLAYKANREGVEDHFPDPSVRKTIEVDVSLIDHYDQVLREVELYITRSAKVHDGQSFARLQSVPGIGPILALVLLYEIQDSTRFPRVQDFVSYCRLVKCAKESNGKRLGASGKKIGNVHLRWAFAEAAVLFLRQNHPGKAYFAKLAHKHGNAKALTVLAHKLARAVYYMLTREQPFDLHRVVAV